MFEFSRSHMPSALTNSCPKAESAFYAYLLCERELTILKTGDITSVLKIGFGYPTLLALTSVRAGWIWDTSDDSVGNAGVFWRRPLMADADPYEAQDVSNGLLLDKKGKNIDRSKISSEQGRLIFRNCLDNYLDNLIALIKQRELSLDESIFRTNVMAYTSWLAEQQY